MKPLLALTLAGALAASTTTAPVAPLNATTPPAVDRWRWNARERSAAGRAALERGDAAAAIEAFDAARRLRPDDPRTLYNAGTARIGTDPQSAAPLLDGAAQKAGPGLAPSAWYNLGNARLAAGDAKGAVDSYVEALRRDPRYADAKQNLELALQALAEQQKKRDQQANNPSNPGKDGADSKPRGKDSQGDPSRRESSPQNGESGAGSPPSGADSRPEENPGSASSGAGGQRPSPLPQFRDLPDMTAEQAAAILRSVEDLERKQRHDKALQAAQQRAKVEKDW